MKDTIARLAAELWRMGLVAPFQVRVPRLLEAGESQPFSLVLAPVRPTHCPGYV
jgi:hypothetical protein